MFCLDHMDVSIILPIHNAEEWLDDCLESICKQTFSGKVEVSVFNDASTDKSSLILEKWKDKFQLVLSNPTDNEAKGVGYARNKAIEQSSGQYLCFLDADDVMHIDRIKKQHEIAVENQDAIIGCQFKREPENSTIRYTKWANNLSHDELYTQIYTSHGPTLIMPTWFCHRNVYKKVGKFNEGGKGIPEDFIFFYEHLEKGGKLYKINEILLTYRYHPSAATLFVKEDSIWDLRLFYLEKNILTKWNSFTIWNAGKQGRRFYRSLSQENRNKVMALCDVDAKKIDRGFYTFYNSTDIVKPTIPIVHYQDANRPFVICVKLDLTNGNFEKNLRSLRLEEGKDYIHFS